MKIVCPLYLFHQKLWLMHTRLKCKIIKCRNSIEIIKIFLHINFITARKDKGTSKVTRIHFFWNVTLCCWMRSFIFLRNRGAEILHGLLNPEIKALQDFNNQNHSSSNTASHAKRPISFTTLFWERPTWQVRLHKGKRN